MCLRQENMCIKDAAETLAKADTETGVLEDAQKSNNVVSADTPLNYDNFKSLLRPWTD